MKGKGQITIYIVIGLVLLIFIGIIIYLSNRSETIISDGARDRALQESVPDFALPLKRFVDQCAYDVLFKGVQMAGIGGGVIYPNEIGLSFDYLDPTSSDGVSFFPSGGINVPYWSYVLGDNDCENGCVDILAIPELEGDFPDSIQSQIELYFKRNIDRCLDASQVMSEMGYDYEILDDMDVEVEFGDREVVVSFYYPMRVYSVDNDYFDVKYFTSSVPINFREYYEGAGLMAAMLHDTKILDSVTLELISVYSGMDSSLLPPMSDLSLESHSSLFWITHQVKTKLYNLLISNIPKFTITNSENFNPIDEFYDVSYYSLKKNFYEMFQLPALPGFDPFNINLMYGGWNMFLNIDDGKEQIIRPDSLSVDWFPFFGVNRIRTMYSLSYPVVITLANPSDVFPNGESFIFNFAVEVNIRNNDVMNATTYESFDYSTFDDFKSKDTFLCDYDMRTSMNVSFDLIDGKTSNPVSGAELYYICGEETCNLGLLNNNGTFNSPLPICMGGHLKIVKHNYETIAFDVSPSISDPREFGDIIIEPYRDLDVVVKNYLIRKTQLGDWILSPAPASYLTDNEIAILNFERIEDRSPFFHKDEFSFFGLVEGSTPTQIRLLPGIYSGSIQGILYEDILIHPEERSFSQGPLRSKLRVDIPEETMVIDEYSGAGAIMDVSTGYLRINKEDLDSSESIIFYQFFGDLPGIPELERVIEDLEGMNKYMEFSQDHRRMLNPTFVRAQE